MAYLFIITIISAN